MKNNNQTHNLGAPEVNCASHGSSCQSAQCSRKRVNMSSENEKNKSPHKEFRLYFHVVSHLQDLAPDSCSGSRVSLSDVRVDFWLC